MSSFSHLAVQQKRVKHHTPLWNILKTSLEVCTTKSPLPPLLNEYLIASLGSAYFHFGIGLFSSLGEHLFISKIYETCGVPPPLLTYWMKNVTQFLQEESKLEAFEWSESKREMSFAKSLLKRLFSCEPKEDSLTGLDLLDQKNLAPLRQRCTNALASLFATAQTNNFDREHPDSHAAEESPFPTSTLAASFEACVNDITRDPLILLAWRLESFAHFATLTQAAGHTPPPHHAIFISTQTPCDIETNTQKMTALMALMIPYRNAAGQSLLPDSPLTPQQIVQILNKNHTAKDQTLCLDPIQKWLGTNEDLPSFKNTVSDTLEAGVGQGVLFKISHPKKGFSYGLTSAGLQIMAPFFGILNETLSQSRELSKTSRDEAREATCT